MTSTATKIITLLLVDDSELVRTGLKTLLATRADGYHLQVLGEASSVATAVTETTRLQPDVVLLDIRLPDGTGFEACRQILAQLPDTRVLILTSVIDDNLVYEAMSSGAHGYLLKEINAQALWQAIIDVASGKFILDPAVTTRVLNLVRHGAPQSEQDKLAQLSAQERRVLALVADGKTNKEIAEQMGLSDKTVKNYLSNIFEKLQISRRSQAAVLYAESRSPKPPVRP
ncbi:MAG: response regulator transcription factor [Candidatus Didemnitutus sp.]|nr:response regulator transcription factor [Candidatus Didemnitutus sp.]